MTVENCLRLAKHHREMGDEMAAMMYEDRAKKKESKYTKEYLLEEASRLQQEGKGGFAQSYIEKAFGKKPKKAEVKKEDGKK